MNNMTFTLTSKPGFERVPAGMALRVDPGGWIHWESHRQLQQAHRVKRIARRALKNESK